MHFESRGFMLQNETDLLLYNFFLQNYNSLNIVTKYSHYHPFLTNHYFSESF